MKFKSLVLIVLLLSVKLFADSKVQLEKVDANKYPMVHIYMNENKAKPLQGESIHLTETKEGFTRQVHTINILKSNQLRPIRLILSIQASNELDRLH